MECMKDSFRQGVVLNDRYETLSYVHEGSFGMVFKARDLRTGEVVAVKCLTKRSVVDDAHAEFAAEDSLEDSEELAIHRHLGSHPNIVNLLTSFETESHLYFVLEYCERGDLYEAIRAGQGPVGLEDVRQLMLEIIDAVAYIHSKGVYHRDIKPENIFLTNDGRVKLGDFGLATTEEWSFETAVGSDRYMAPEQCESDGAGYNPAQADIWSIGICLLNILFSKNPFSQPTTEDPFYRDFFTDSRSLFDIFDTMSEDTFDILEHSLNLNPAKRSLSKMRRALHRVVSFTTSCEDVDAFLVGSPKAQATANREPLGTPAIQSPSVDQCGWGESSFWTRSLQATPPQPIRSSKLHVFDDADNYSEDLFGNSVESSDWCSANTVQSHSLASTVDSSSDRPRASEFNLTLPDKYRGKFTSEPSAVAGSLPINMAKPKPARPLDAVFGSKDKAAPKSWSDMFDEELEEESEIQIKFNALKENNARTFSHESNTGVELRANHMRACAVKLNRDDDDDATPLATAPESKLDVEGLFMYEPPSPKRETPITSASVAPWPRQIPPLRKSASSMDKWSALGERRRAFAESADKKHQPQRQFKYQPPIPASNHSTNTTSALTGSLEFNRPRRTFGFGHNNFAYGSGNVEHQSSTSHANAYNFNRNRDHRSGQSKDGHGCPWTRRYDFGGLHRDGGLRGDCRDWNWRRENRQHFGKIEWVGGCVEARS